MWHVEVSVLISGKQTLLFYLHLNFQIVVCKRANWIFELGTSIERKNSELNKNCSRKNKNCSYLSLFVKLFFSFTSNISSYNRILFLSIRNILDLILKKKQHKRLIKMDVLKWTFQKTYVKTIHKKMIGERNQVMQ